MPRISVWTSSRYFSCSWRFFATLFFASTGALPTYPRYRKHLALWDDLLGRHGVEEFCRRAQNAIDDALRAAPLYETPRLALALHQRAGTQGDAQKFDPIAYDLRTVPNPHQGVVYRGGEDTKYILFAPRPLDLSISEVKGFDLAGNALPEVPRDLTFSIDRAAAPRANSGLVLRFDQVEEIPPAEGTEPPPPNVSSRSISETLSTPRTRAAHSIVRYWPRLFASVL